MRNDNEPERARIRRPRRSLLPTFALAAALVPGASRGQSMASLPPPGPQVSALSPASGPAAGGTVVTVTGYRMQSGASLGFGGAAATGLSYPSTVKITATTPSAPAGTLRDVLLTNPDTSTAVLPGGWFANYSDVPASYLFHDAIEKITRKGITTGCGSGNYCPDTLVTRGEMAVFLLRGKHGSAYTPPPATGTLFGDVTVSTPYARWIEELFHEGITTGCGNGDYCPTSTVTRDAMAVFLLRAEHGSTFHPPTAVGLFTDVPVGAPFADWIEQLANEGVTAGCGPGTYCPSSTVTRGQMAVFLSKNFNADIVRLLEQATWGPTEASIDAIRKLGINGWLADQFAQPASSYPTMALQPTTVPASCDSTCQRDNYSAYLIQRRFFSNALYGPDQLRQRVAWALHKLVVVSQLEENQPSWMTNYLQIFDRNAFGNFRQLLNDVTLNPAMGDYLNMRTSTKFSPNENYGREILQLFSIGLNKLNPDGTVQVDGVTGDPVPTYDQSVVSGFAKVFTGWRLDADVATGVPDYLDPMVLKASNHDTTAKQVLGKVLPSGQTGDKDLSDALDNIFNNANTGVYVSLQLIHSLVTSNPSPGYVQRVSTVFADNGSGVRGDLKAVVQAILTDPEARGDVKTDPLYGHAKEPVLFVLNLLRALNARSADGASQSDGYLSPQTSSMNQDVFRPPTVFSYYPADFLVPGTTDVLGPEFGILTATTALKKENFVNTMVFSKINTSGNAPNGTSIDLSGLQALTGSPEAVVTQLNHLLMHGAMSDEMRSDILTAVNAVSSTKALLRAQQAVYLVGTSMQFQVER